VAGEWRLKISAELREYAETPDRYAPVIAGSSVSRFDDGRVCVIQGPTWASISAPNVADDQVEALLAETRALIPPEKLTTWWIGPSARPADVVERLEALGLRTPHDRVSQLSALARTEEPAEIPAGVEVCRVETFDDFAAAREVQWDASRHRSNAALPAAHICAPTSTNRCDSACQSFMSGRSTGAPPRLRWRSRQNAASS
jgi:hypothetical protein